MQFLLGTSANIMFILMILMFAIVHGEVVPGCPNLSYQDNIGNGNQLEPLCYCDNATDYGGGPSNSVAINCLNPASLSDLALVIKHVTDSQLQLYSISMNGLVSEVYPNGVQKDFYFKNLNVYPSHLSVKSCMNDTTKLIIGDKFFGGLEDSLMSLTIYDCPLREIPSNLKSFKNLERLRLQSTSVSEIKSDDLFASENLLALDLQSNNMVRIDTFAFGKLPNLQSLILGRDNNFTESIFTSIKNLTSLITLDLSGNRIAKLDQKPFALFEQLEILYLNDNLILTIPDDVFEKSSQLIELHLAQNLIDTIQERAFSSLINLQKLSLSDNFLINVQSLMVSLPNLQTLDLSFNELISLEKESFKNLPNLTRLNLNDNKKLRNIDRDAFVGLSELLSLDLSSTNISSIDPDLFKPVTKLTDLNLSHTKISFLPKNVFVNNKNLVSLNLISTELSTIAEGLFDDNKNLTNLFISNNRWLCDKDLVYLSKWLQENENNVHVADEFRVDQTPTCYNPQKLFGLPLRAINVNQLHETVL